MSAFATFGDPARFEIALRWKPDQEPRGRQPQHSGWSMGELRLTVANQVLTRHRQAGRDHDSLRWYLLPVFEWLARNWVSLLHEENLGWRDNAALPAATAAFLALRRLIDAQSPEDRRQYVEIQDWWRRHALRSADPSALYPDLVLRRHGDDIEVSWTARQPVHAPDGFRFVSTPGAAALPVSEVAEPLWEAMNWVVSSCPPLAAQDRASLEALEHELEALARLPVPALEAGFLPVNLLDQVIQARGHHGLPDRSVMVPGAPALARLDDAVLMFGGVNPAIGREDVEGLVAFMAEKRGGRDSDVLTTLVDHGIGAPLSAPYEEGYDLADRVLEHFDLPGHESFVDIETLLTELDVGFENHSLNTDSIRGVALAGDGYFPAILVNVGSRYNREDTGRRFTLAHELFHILYDRSRARRVAHTSGPWASPGVEKRANAFAAMLLMPRSLVRRSLPDGPLDKGALLSAARDMRVGASALLEHLYNISMIDEVERDRLRAALTQVRPRRQVRVSRVR